MIIILYLIYMEFRLISKNKYCEIFKINDKLLNFGYRMDRGYGNLRGHAFRIAHMGNIYQTDLKEYLSDFDKVLLDV